MALILGLVRPNRPVTKGLRSAVQLKNQAFSQAPYGSIVLIGSTAGQRVSAVQYVRFPVSDATVLQKGPAAIVIDHPAYTHRQELPEAVRAALARDLVAEGS